MLVGLLGGGAIGVLATALVAFFTSRREHSGHIATSEAKELWEENRAFREAQRLEIEALRHQLTAVNALREQEHQDVLALHEKYGGLEEAHRALKEEHRQCKEDLATLTTELRKM